jgi:hypothetical protein
MIGGVMPHLKIDRTSGMLLKELIILFREMLHHKSEHRLNA